MREDGVRGGGLVDSGTVVMNNGEELDSRSVIINGKVRVEGPSRFAFLRINPKSSPFDQVLHTEPWPGLRHQANHGQGVPPEGEFLNNTIEDLKIYIQNL